MPVINEKLEEAVGRLGGAARVARLVSRKPQTIYNWLRWGCIANARDCFIVTRACERLGLAITYGDLAVAPGSGGRGGGGRRFRSLALAQTASRVMGNGQTATGTTARAA